MNGFRPYTFAHRSGAFGLNAASSLVDYGGRGFRAYPDLPRRSFWGN